MPENLGEFDVIARYFKQLATSKGAFQLKDDAAVLEVPAGKKLVISKDMLVGGIHFFVDDLPDLIARKALRTNISDIISKGADPAFYSLGLSYPGILKHDFISDFCSGLEADQDFYGLSLLGGDTTNSQNDFVISITIYGFCDIKGPVTRLGGKEGDFLYVTGTLGNSALGLESLKNPERFSSLDERDLSTLQSFYLLPQPPFGIQKLINDYANASMDISDGLLADCTHLCKASKCSATLHLDALPFHKIGGQLALEDREIKNLLVRGGDDYQCLMAVSPQNAAAFENAAQTVNIRVSCIGALEVQKKEALCLLEDGIPSSIVPRGYVHF